MSLWIDLKYAKIIGAQLDHFKQINDYLFNFRCPICGDSKHNKTKTRGYIYKVKDKLNVKCHNCGYSSHISSFLKEIDTNLYNQYRLDNISNLKPIVENPFEKFNRPVVSKDPNLYGLKRLDSLPVIHPAIKYIVSRKIPRKYWNILYYTDKFKEYINKIEVKYPNTDYDHPRIIIPYLDINKECFAISARALGNEEPKYFNMKIKEDVESIYGLDRVNKNETIYCVEGPLDSLFLPNGIAVTGTSFNKDAIKELKKNLVIIPDREPRSTELVKIVNNLVEDNFTISLLPESFVYKDINEAIKNGMSIETIMEVINTNTHSGIAAKLNFNSWKKC